MKRIFLLSLFAMFATSSFSQQFRKMRECIIENGILKEIEIDYNPATGDRSIVINGVRKDFYAVYPTTGAGYAASAPWFINNETVLFQGRPYVKYGLPRVLGVNEISKSGVYKTTNVYVEAGITGPVEVIYIPVRQGCEFQPYQLNCGSVKIEALGNSKGKSRQFTAKTTGLTGKIKYEWKGKDIMIVKGQGTATVSIDLKNVKESEVDLVLVVSDAKKCPVSSYYYIELEQPPVITTTTTKSKWTAKDRKDFNDNCVPSTKLPEPKGKAYCSCMLEKIEKAHPNPLTVEQELKQEVIEKWARECLPGNSPAPNP